MIARSTIHATGRGIEAVRCLSRLREMLDGGPDLRVRVVSLTEDRPDPSIGTLIVWKPADLDHPKKPYLVQRVDISAYRLNGKGGNFRSDLADLHPDPAAFHIIGNCPSCTHPSSAVCATKFIKSESEKGPKRQVTLLRCACIARHAEEKADLKADVKPKLGCGSEWLLQAEFPKNAGAAVTFSNVPNDKLHLYWSTAEDRSLELPTFLAQAQGAAAKWQTALTAILGLLAIGTILTGRDRIAVLDDKWKVLIALALGLALLGNACMLYFSNVASIGAPSPRKRWYGFGEESLENADLAPLEKAAKSRAKLRLAFWFAVVSFIGALGAVAIYTFVPLDESPTYTVKYLKGTSEKLTTCGTYHTAGVNLTLTPTDKSISAVTVPQESVLEVVAC